jgi:hypothetical protein
MKLKCEARYLTVQKPAALCPICLPVDPTGRPEKKAVKVPHRERWGFRFSFFFESYINCMKGFHCDISICAYNVL